MGEQGNTPFPPRTRPLLLVPEQLKQRTNRAGPPPRARCAALNATHDSARLLTYMSDTTRHDSAAEMIACEDYCTAKSQYICVARYGARLSSSR
eukprot:6182798-Pleurochrysis_carterae.AAC.1